MSTPQPKTNHTSKQPRFPASMGCFGFLFVSTCLLYYGYCWGFWGRDSLLLQFLFQCNCPVLSEEWRYPREVDVIVSACDNGDVALSPSGRLLYVHQKGINLIASTYVLNLQTNEQISLAVAKGSTYLLTDDLLFHSFHGMDQYILDIATGIKYPIQDAMQLQPSIEQMGDVEPGLLLNALSQVDQIFFIDDTFRPVIALSSDFRSHPEKGFTFDSLDFPSNAGPIEEFLQQNNISYHYVPGVYSVEALSQDGRFIARQDGI